MASWVITIRAEDFPQHWEYAQRDGVWDMPKHFKIHDGDYVYFRVSGGPLVGQTMATCDARPLAATDHVPWDDGRDPYSTRFTIHVLSDEPIGTTSWAEIASRLSYRPTLQAPREWVLASDEQVLASFFPTQSASSTVESALAEVLRDAGVEPTDIDLTSMENDLRTFARRLHAVRSGQERFRQDLLQAYGGCAITNTRVPAVLEAAHIARYLGQHTHLVRNGILLRRDIHRLFDDHLLTVRPDYTVRISPTLHGSDYWTLDDSRLCALPMHKFDRPSAKLLAAHNDACGWLEG